MSLLEGGGKGEGEWSGEFDPLSDPEEKRVVFAALDSFCQYRKVAHLNVTHRRRQNFYALPSAQWQVLAAPPFSILDTFERVDDAIDKNADIASAILEAGLEGFGLDAVPTEESRDWRGTATPSDLDKARSTIRQFYRDWSAEGAEERAACYGPILTDLEHEFLSCQDRGAIKVLVPGAGLGRLVFEICAAGFWTEGNEISYHQLMASNFVLNRTSATERMELFPWALSFSNHVSREHQLQRVMIPDIHPGTALGEASSHTITPASQRLSMSAADFALLYSDTSHRGYYDAVATVFFVDTAPNLMNYISTIRNCLKVQGIWINFGPLLWHFEDSNFGPKETAGEEQPETKRNRQQKGIAGAGSVEFTDEEVILLIESSGFKIERHMAHGGESGYIQDPRSMLQNTYIASHWVARRLE
ncbi:MAG: hypothetical protein M1819_005899 [Sarea resinae]|nr:MAG: hypothetical protein M1819_005899 [Sarea resinae]